MTAKLYGLSDKIFIREESAEELGSSWCDAIGRFLKVDLPLRYSPTNLVLA